KHRSGGSLPSTLWTASRDGSLVTASVPSSPASNCASRSLLNCIRRRGFALAIGTIEEIHEVIDFQPGSILLRSVTELKDAAGIGRDNDFGLSCSHGCQFLREMMLGHAGMDNVVNAGAATAAIRPVHFLQLQFGNSFQQIPRLVAHPLAVREMAGVLIGR